MPKVPRLMMVLILSIPGCAMLLSMMQLNLSNWQALAAFWQKLTYQLVQMIIIFSGCSGEDCIIKTGVCLWVVLVLVSPSRHLVLLWNGLLDRG